MENVIRAVREALEENALEYTSEGKLFLLGPAAKEPRERVCITIDEEGGAVYTVFPDGRDERIEEVLRSLSQRRPSLAFHFLALEPPTPDDEKIFKEIYAIISGSR